MQSEIQSLSKNLLSQTALFQKELGIINQEKQNLKDERTRFKKEMQLERKMVKDREMKMREEFEEEKRKWREEAYWMKESAIQNQDEVFELDVGGSLHKVS